MRAINRVTSVCPRITLIDLERNLRSIASICTCGTACIRALLRVVRFNSRQREKFTSLITRVHPYCETIASLPRRGVEHERFSRTFRFQVAGKLEMSRRENVLARKDTRKDVISLQSMGIGSTILAFAAACIVEKWRRDGAISRRHDPAWIRTIKRDGLLHT